MKKTLSLLLSLALMVSMIPATFAASDEATNAANTLNGLGLFDGTGKDANGNPIYDLDRVPTRQEAITMLVRLLGKADEAVNGTWETPFTDVANWAKPYVGYAYANGLTSGTSATTFGSADLVNATQYLTFVLRALGYEDGVDFQWNKAWELTDKIGATDGRYNENNHTFLRGDIAMISNNSLTTCLKDSDTTLAALLLESEAINQGVALLQEVAPNLKKESFFLDLNEDGYYVLSLADLQDTFPQVTDYSHMVHSYLGINHETNNALSLNSDIALSNHFYHLYEKQPRRITQSGFYPHELEEKLTILLFSDTYRLCGFYVGIPALQEDGSYKIDFTLCDDYDFEALYHEQVLAYEQENIPYIDPAEIETSSAKFQIRGYISSTYDSMVEEDIKRTQLFFMWNVLHSELVSRQSSIKYLKLRGESENWWRYYLLLDENKEILGYTLG